MFDQYDNIHTILMGGFGNQLFMIFNTISLAKKYNKNYSVYYNQEYIKNHYNAHEKLQKSADNYNIFKKINLKHIDDNILNSYVTLNESEYRYNNIILKDNTNYKLDGYFQSYKYFWEYRKYIKNELYIDSNKLNDIKNILNGFAKKTIALHMRLTDYINLSDYHTNQPIEYYKKVLDKYDLSQYQIILFSDDIKLAHEILKPLDINYIDASDIYTIDEDQFLLMSNCNVIICSNSSFSLMSCYLNEIYTFTENAQYYVPYIWFGPKGPKYDMYDLISINNNKFNIIVYNDEIYGIFLIATGNYKSYLDIIIPSIKDKFLIQNKKILLISTDDITYLDKFNELIDDNFKIIHNKIYNRGFPADTLYRFEYFLHFKDTIYKLNIHYLLFINLNCNLMHKIDTLSISNCDMFFTKHPGYAVSNNMFSSIETRSNLSCYIDINSINENNKIYVYGALNGGKTNNYLSMCEILKNNIIKDDLNNIIAVWHDESQLNWYRIMHLKSNEYIILSHLYCCPLYYDNNTYINVQHKDFSLRYKSKYLITYTTNLNTDLLRIIYYSFINSCNISIPILNNNYHSYRQGILKNFFRIDIKSHNYNANNINLIDDSKYDLLYDFNYVQNFLDIFNININIDNELIRLKNHAVVHISKKFEKFKKHIFNMIKNNFETKYLIVFHDNEHKNYTDWENFNNISFYDFKDDEEKIIFMSQAENHIFYNLSDIYMLINIRKKYINNSVNLNYLYCIDESNIDEINYMDNYFNLNKIPINEHTIPNNSLCFILFSTLGDQLFMLFNTIALSKKYNKQIDISHNNNCRNNYELFKNINFKYISTEDLNHYYQKPETEFIFNEIVLDGKNYMLRGYYQSYKYFWDYRDEIKEHLYINPDKLGNIKNKINQFGKKTIALHMNISDISLEKYHNTQPIEYYKIVLDKYDLSQYQIILFTNDYQKSEEKLRQLNIEYIDIINLYDDIEDQLLFICNCDVIICANSSFSLSACYLNEIFKFNNESKYYVSNMWFGIDGPKYDINDLVPINNDKFEIIQIKKCAVIFFHKNIYNLYEKYWIDKCRNSIMDQKNIKFDIYEINYGNENRSIFDGITIDNKIKHIFTVKDYETHTEAMIHLLNNAFDDKYDIVYNTNLDDYFDLNRFYYQYIDIIYNGSLMNSTLFTHIMMDNLDEEKDIIRCGDPNNPNNKFTYINNDFIWVPYETEYNYDCEIMYEDIKKNLLINHNVISHPAVCFTYDFWNATDKYGNKLRYRNDKPYEDLSLWIRAVNNNIKISIINRHLTWYRNHNKSICSQKSQIEHNNLYEKFKDFHNGPYLTDVNIGYLAIIDGNNFNKIAQMEKNIDPNKKKFYLIFIRKEFEIQLVDFLTEYELKKVKVVIYDNNSDLSFNNIYKDFRSTIEMNTDIFLQLL